MAEDMDALFIFGDNLEAILDELEEGEGVQEQFSVAVSNVSVKKRLFDSKCRSNKLKKIYTILLHIQATLAIIFQSSDLVFNTDIYSCL